MDRDTQGLKKKIKTLFQKRGVTAGAVVVVGLFAVTGLMLLNPGSAATTPRKVMPLGDSLTDGYSYAPGGYRVELCKKFAAGTITFVGSLSNRPASGNIACGNNHEGHSGWFIKDSGNGQDLYTHVQSWLNTYKPDDILLHIGTNDIGSGNISVATFEARMNALVDRITSTAPNSNLLLSTLAPMTSDDTRQYSDRVRAIVTANKNAGKKVFLVETDKAGITYPGDYPPNDGWHLSASGYAKMATKFYETLSAVCGSNPTPTPPTPTPPTPTPPPADTTRPTVTLTAPQSGSSSAIGSTVNMTANASDNVAVTKVEFYNGTTLLGTDTTTPYSYAWNTTGQTSGSKSLTARAYDAANNNQTSATVAITLTSPQPVDTVPPIATLTAPAANSSAAVGATVNMAATASDNVGVSKVEFYSGSTLLGTDTTAPYSYAWNTSGQTAGSKSLTAKAYDAANNSQSSAAVSLTLTSGSGSTPGDANGDGRVNALDLSALISNDGKNYPPADFNKDGTVGAADLSILLSRWTW